MVSDVPLTEDVVKRKPSIVSPTFMEWVSDGNAEQIIRRAGVAGATAKLIIYSVPKNFTFFMTSCFITIMCGSGAPAQRTGRLILPTDVMLLEAAIVGGNTAESIAQSFTMPIRVVSGDIFLTSSANSVVQVGIQGFILPLKLAIR